ncbi:MAG: 2-C-methyl-D-erythritol 4-phosphate cytidylyltransferase [Bacteroidota bacterium]|nr:2-C-methyl-D-erythritol 4-phosphate cytidylyltransferase [Bacteroidota bacterium]
MQQFVIIVAGGSGERMQSEVPKQFLVINGTPLLMISIKAFHRYNPSITIIVALPEQQIEFWRNLCEKHAFNIHHQIVKGGKTRYHSVKNALETINSDGIVAIHDGVRPLVSQETIQRVFETAESNSNAVPYLDMFDSVRYLNGDKNRPVDRSKYKLIQTPQAFDGKIILQAYEQPFEPSFTDDASVAEKAGQKINLVAGNRENIKITTQVDLIVAKALWNHLSE